MFEEGSSHHGGKISHGNALEILEIFCRCFTIGKLWVEQKWAPFFSGYSPSTEHIMLFTTYLFQHTCVHKQVCDTLSSSFSLCNFCQFWLERWGIVAQFLSAYIVKLTAMKVCKISITTFTLKCRWNHVNFFALHNKHIVISTLTSGMMYDWLWSMKFLNSIFFQWC